MPLRWHVKSRKRVNKKRSSLSVQGICGHFMGGCELDLFPIFWLSMCLVIVFQWWCGIYWFSGAFALLCDVDLISWRTTSPQSTSGQDVLPTGQFIIAFFSIVNLVVFKSLFLSFSVCKYNVRKN